MKVAARSYYQKVRAMVVQKMLKLLNRMSLINQIPSFCYLPLQVVHSLQVVVSFVNSREAMFLLQMQ